MTRISASAMGMAAGAALFAASSGCAEGLARQPKIQLAAAMPRADSALGAARARVARPLVPTALRAQIIRLQEEVARHSLNMLIDAAAAEGEAEMVSRAH